nr:MULTISPECIES: DUF2188 domain-containing protein [unclassified Cryobacterium]
MDSIRVVTPGVHVPKWALRSSFSPDTTISTHATQSDAIAAGRKSLTPGGGLIRVCGLDGQLRSNIRAPAQQQQDTGPLPDSAPSKSSADPGPPLVAGANIAFSVLANASGETHDANEDGRDDGEAALTSLLDTRDGSPANLFFKGTGQGINLTLSVVLPALAAFGVVYLQGAETLGATYWTVYLATIAWSGGISVATFVGILGPVGWSAGHYLATIGGGFGVSSVLAGVVGGPTIATPTALASPELYRIFAPIPKNREGFLAIAFMLLAIVIWYVAVAGVATYGLLGLFLGAVVGVAIGWQAAHRVKTTLMRQAQLPGASPS